MLRAFDQCGELLMNVDCQPEISGLEG